MKSLQNRAGDARRGRSASPLDGLPGLVMTNIAIVFMALIEIVDLPNFKMGGFSICERLPEGISWKILFRGTPIEETSIFHG